MKKVFYSLLIMIIPVTAICQDSFKFKRTNGLNLGSGISTFHSEKASDSFQPKPVYFLGYLFGREYEKMNYTLAFSVESKGALKEDGNWRYGLTYYTISPTLNIKIKPVRSSIFIGCYGSILLFRSVSSDSSALVGYTINGFKRFDYGVLTGLSSRIYKFSDYSVFLDFQVDYGLYDMFDNSPFYISHRESKWDRNFSMKIGISIIKN